MSNNAMGSSLLPYWNPLVERFGLVLLEGTIIELKNVSLEPRNQLIVDRAEVDQFKGSTQATWHTHPNNRPNLSAEDYWMFLALPPMDHYIITETKVRKFSVRNGKVMLDEAHCV